MMGNNNAGVAPLVLGILSLVFIFIFAPVGLILGIVGVILASKAKNTVPDDMMAKAGFVMSLIGLIVCAIVTVILIFALAIFGMAVGFGLSALSSAISFL